MRIGDSWRLRDHFAREWLITLCPPPGARDDQELWHQRCAIEGLVHSSFQSYGATHDRIARVLLEVYDALTGDDLSRQLPSPTRDPQRRLSGFDETLRRRLESAATAGLVRIERLPERPWPFPDGAPLPVPPPPLAPATEPTTYFVLRVVDEVGQGVDGIQVVLSADGAQRTLVTDGAGMARLDGALSSVASFRLASLTAVREKLKPRWAEPREPQLLKGAGVVVRELGDDALDAVSLESETLTTLVLTPYFQCHEIAGAHFEFGRSFVRSGALELLAEIAQALGGDDGRKGIIFGHTDRAGSEALNKELSERRGKALYALLTQDADAWEELYAGSADGPSWREKWDLEEIQHMLNALGVTDDAGSALVEDGLRGPLTTQAVTRFQSRDYPDCPAEQAPLDADGVPGKQTRRELFLAYAKRVSREPVEAERLTSFGSAKYMGCGEYNPLSVTALDEESRRAVIFVYEPAAEPRNLPCQLRTLAPCRANSSPVPKAVDPGGKPPYRCKVYREVAKKCPCQAGPDLSHDLLVRVPVTLQDAADMPHVFVLESDDATIRTERSLRSNARALSDFECELHFNSLPENHSYRLSYEADGAVNELFPFTPYDLLPDVVVPNGIAGDVAPVATMFSRMDQNDDAFDAALSPAPTAGVPDRDPGDTTT